jgi:HD-GYP domain-containing protein (c-di-GMP phosphodiesterase class II)
MLKELKVPLFELVSCLSNAMDMVDPRLVDHHNQVAYTALRISKELGLSFIKQQELVLASMLHDIGALSLSEKLTALQFEIENPHQHAEIGYLLLKTHGPFTDIANLIRFHHVPWHDGEGAEFSGEKVSLSSHIIHLADRIAVSVDKRHEILAQVPNISSQIERGSGEIFVPELVNIFKDLAQREYFWCDLVSKNIGSILSKEVILPTIEQDIDNLISLAKVFAHIIDFRSRFTATHSSGVSTTAATLAKFARFTERECKMMAIAGYLHDLGKLAVPIEILEKPAKLSDDEFNIMRHHTYFTYRALEAIDGFETINTWASFHHERINGSGYPFHYKGRDIPLGSRIVAVADVFTAITEDRPYRKGMTEDNAIHVLQEMADNLFLDGDLVTLLKEHFDEINLARKIAQASAVQEYEQFMKLPAAH